jgi:sugar lactone lactonase YvrE
MKSTKVDLVFRAALAVITCAGVVACSAGKQPGPDRKQAGTFQMSLVATTNGHTYRLRQALFHIDGPNTLVLDSDAQPDATALMATLDAGSYTATLTPGWFLERLAADGSAARVNATLASANPTSFTVTAGATASVAFAFSTDGTIVTVGQGQVAISVDVTENGGQGQLTLLAGNLGGFGSGDGVGHDARFDLPGGAATDGAGNLFIADTFNHTIRKIVLATAQVTTIAGTPNARGLVDGVGAAARFDTPLGLAVAGGGLFVADNSNNAIRRIDLATGEVTTVAGGNGSGAADGPGLTASFSSPFGLASDGAGSLFVTDLGNGTIRRIDVATGQVSTFAGTAQLFGTQDGAGSEAQFESPEGIASDGAGNLYVLDTTAGTIRKIVIATAEVTTLAGSPFVSNGSVDGTGTAARFTSPQGLCADGAGNLFVADTSADTIRRVVIATAEVTTIAGSFTPGRAVDGVGAAASFDSPEAIATDGAGNLYVTDTFDNTIRKVVVATAQVTTFAGLTPTFGSRDGTGAAALFGGVDDTFSDGAGNLFISDGVNNTIRKIVIATAEVTTIAGTAGLAGSLDGRGAAARFNDNSGLTGDGAGNLYVADTESNTIRKIVIATGDVTTLAGSPGLSGSDDGVGAAARFSFPQGLTSDGAGNLYVGDSGNFTVRKIVIATGEVTTLAGSLGFQDGVGTAAGFQSPRAVAADGHGNVFVADGFANTIRKIVIATAEVTTLAGSAGVSGDQDGTGAAALFDFPEDIAADGAGHVFVSDANHIVRRIDTTTGVVTTVLGVRNSSGVVLGAIPARVNFPAALSVLPDGALAFGDEGAVLIARF